MSQTLNTFGSWLDFFYTASWMSPQVVSLYFFIPHWLACYLPPRPPLKDKLTWVHYHFASPFLPLCFVLTLSLFFVYTSSLCLLLPRTSPSAWVSLFSWKRGPDDDSIFGSLCDFCLKCIQSLISCQRLINREKRTVREERVFFYQRNCLELLTCAIFFLHSDKKFYSGFVSFLH